MPSVIASIGTATPAYCRAQDDIAGLMASGANSSLAHKKIIERIHANSGIDQRYSVLSDYLAEPGQFDFLSKNPTTAERMDLYKQHALALALSAIHNALHRLPTLNKQAITHLITVSCTGMYAPGLDIDIVQQLALMPSVKRTAVNFMGCYGAFNGMKLADAICRADPGSVVLVVCVELCSIHIQKEVNMNNMVANALFADGAAAMIVQQHAPYLSQCLRMDGFYCELVSQTNQDMAWHITNFGFEMVLSSYVPRAIEAGIAALIIKLREHAMMPLHTIDYYAIHPGGVKILQACEQALGLTAHDNRFSYEVLRQHGNMSSATVLFVLRAIWNDLSAPDSQKSILSCAFGPGLTLESALLTVH